MQQTLKQVKITESQFGHGLMDANVPGEPVAYLRSTPDELEHRYHLTFQDSFDNLDSLQIAVLELAAGPRIALVHHEGFPDDETEVYADRADWRTHDVLPTILETLEIPETELSWRQSWPQSALGS